MKVGPAVNKAVANVLALCIALFVAFSGYASTTAHADTVTTPFEGDLEFEVVGPGAVTVTDPANEPPSIVTHPMSSVVTIGYAATFKVQATGMGPLTYQWQVNAGSGFQNISDGGVYSGATTSTLNLTLTTEDMDGYLYRVIVTSAGGQSTTSNAATLRINHRPAFINLDARLTVLANDEPVDIRSLLRVRDTDTGQILTWWEDMPPTLGNLTIIDATASSGQEDITPWGLITYQPFGYIGTDNFVIGVKDGFAMALLSVRVIIVERPTVSSVVLPPDGTYKAGDSLEFTVKFDLPVTVVGTPQLSLTVGSKTVGADYISGSDTQELLFRYTVQEGDLDEDGISVNALILNGGSIQTRSVDADLTLSGIGDTSRVKVDTAAPQVNSVSVPPNGTYAAGKELEFIVAMNEPVTVTGTPLLNLMIGGELRPAMYIASVSDSELKFRYTVASGDLDDDGIAVHSLSLLAGAGIFDAAGNAAVLSLSNVGDTAGVLVDAVAPQVIGVSVPAAGTYTLGQTLSFKVHFSKEVAVQTDGGTPALPLTIGTASLAAVYVSGTGTNEIVFEYVVQAGDVDTDGIELGSAIELSGGTMTDLPGNAILPQLLNVGDTTGILVDGGALSFEAVPASASPVAGGSNLITLTVKDALGNPVTAFAGEYDVTVSGYEEAPDHSYGSIDDEPLTGAARTVTVLFTAGQAKVDLKLNKADEQSITFGIAGLASTATVGITPVAGPAASMKLTGDIAPPASNGGSFAQQPVVTLVDAFGNVSVHDDSTVVTAVKEDSGVWSLTGTTSRKAEAGVVTFTDLGAINASAVEGARIAFEAEGLPTIVSSAVSLPWPTLEAPVIGAVTSGNGQVRLEWSPVYGAVSYQVYMRTAATDYGTAIADVTDAVYEATGLTNGTTYYFIVKAANPAGISPASHEVSATPQGPSSLVWQPADPGVDVLVNGKPVRAGTARTTVVNGRKHVTVTLDPARIEEKLAAEGEGVVVSIPILSQADVATGELTGQLVKSMERYQAIIEIQTERATYTLPAGQIRVDHIADLFGGNVKLEEIKIRMEIAKPAVDLSGVLQRLGTNETFAIVVPPLEFKVTATHGDQTVEVSRFHAYVERMIAIPEGVDPDKITTGIALEPDGKVRHVPTRIVLIDGQYYARINSLTNSFYAVVWHPLAFRDMAGHWAEEAVNDMGSRMVVDGVGGGNFAPDLPITRAEFAAIIVRALGLMPEDGPVPFTDIKSGDWYAGVVRTAYQYGLMQGYEDSTFRPVERITREQAMVIIARAMAITGLAADLSLADVEQALASFADAADVSDWARSGVAAGIQAGVVSGRDDGRIAPGDSITRSEVAMIVRRLLQKSGLI